MTQSSGSLGQKTLEEVTRILIEESSIDGLRSAERLLNVALRYAYLSGCKVTSRDGEIEMVGPVMSFTSISVPSSK